MEHSTIIHSRNMFIILFFTVSVIAHLIIGTFLNNTNEFTAVLFGFFSIVTLLVMHRSGIKPPVLRNYIVSGYSSYIFLVNTLVPDTAHLLYLMFPIILTVAYTSVWLNITMTVITGVEIIILFYFFKQNYLSINQSGLLTHFAFIFIMITILCLLHTLKIGPIWRMMYSENERMDTILSSKEGYLDLFFEHAEDAIAVFSPHQKILTINPAFENMYGWKKKDIIGKTPVLFPASKEGVVEEHIKNVLNGMSYHLIPTKVMRKDGSVFDAELTISPIYDEHQQIVAMSFIARDITLKLQAEKLKIDSEKVKAIGEIAASVAHEIRNPMTTISGFVQMMNTDTANPYRAYTEMMDSEIKRINLIVSEFLVLSKPNLKRYTEIDIQETLQHVLTMFDIEFTKHSIFCTIEAPKNKTFVNGNEDELKQVFINLLKNAYEALVRDGSITLTITQHKETFTISICDNGPGMDQATLDQLFEPFFTTKQDGTGLGMMITKKIILDHGGTLTVTSKQHKGTETVITLPLIENR